ncbi:MAG TPA: VTT domain-containing protein [Methanoregulaceae archaeon]|nr:VTT domain-containing protein [Methanoregulaceae archaeon]
MIPFVDLVLHFDHYLPQIIAMYGVWTYVFLFVMIFLESALVIFPYLPGDSLLFITGALAGSNLLSLEMLLALLTVAAILGGMVNYAIGYFLGHEILIHKWSLIRKEHVEKTHSFFERYGGFTIVIARFIPFVRSFAPFFAGIGQMNFGHFMIYNILGAVLWIAAFTMGGYFFGNLPIVQENFSLVVLVIIGLSLLGIGSIIISMIKSVGKKSEH